MASNWKEYQEEAAAFFRSIGMSAETDVTIQGVRTSHDIDVLVKSQHVGFEAVWIVECKHWTKPVNKLHVLGLREIVHDVGADKGIMLAEGGFQEGSHQAANMTNVQLTSLAELEAQCKDEVYGMRLRDLLERVSRCEFRYWKFPKQFRKEVGLRPDFAEPGYSSITVMQIVNEIVGEAIQGAYPIELGGYAETLGFAGATLGNHEDVYNAVDQALADLEGRLSVAEAEWQARTV
ncbi:restriction endonuclease [Sphingobium xenophagum]|uniref:restriction endonuclease n=1 Tax=Sphingobium xenophagum TaxID=121428 RepID=UPI001C0BEF1B|nr:restriction endonuclease [Sphingobium xenophagum]QWT15309.1 restriction endonuclease [Sphingobium xenophagum]